MLAGAAALRAARVWRELLHGVRVLRRTAVGLAANERVQVVAAVERVVAHDPGGTRQTGGWRGETSAERGVAQNSPLSRSVFVSEALFVNCSVVAFVSSLADAGLDCSIN